MIGEARLDLYDPILAGLRDFVDARKAVPSLGEINDNIIDFRRAGGIARCRSAFQALAENYRNRQVSRAETIKAVTERLTKVHGFDDGEGMLIIVSPEQFAAFLQREVS